MERPHLTVHPENHKRYCPHELQGADIPRSRCGAGALCSEGVGCPDANTSTIPGCLSARPLQIPSLDADGDPRPPAPACDLSANLSPSPAQAERPHLLVVDLPSLVRLARGPSDRSTGDGHRLATTKVPRTLEETDWIESTGPPCRLWGRARSRPADVLSESALGRPSHRRRATHDRDRSREGPYSAKTR